MAQVKPKETHHVIVTTPDRSQVYAQAWSLAEAERVADQAREIAKRHGWRYTYRVIEASR